MCLGSRIVLIRFGNSVKKTKHSTIFFQFFTLTNMSVNLKFLMFAAQTLRNNVQKFLSQIKRQKMMNFYHLNEAYPLHSFAVDNTKFPRIVGTFSFFIKLKTFCLSRVLKIFKIGHLNFCHCAYAKCPTFVRPSTILAVNGRSIGKCCGQMTFIRHSLLCDAKTGCRSLPKRHQQAYEI